MLGSAPLGHVGPQGFFAISRSPKHPQPHPGVLIPEGDDGFLQGRIQPQVCSARALLQQGMVWGCCGVNELRRVDSGLGALQVAKMRGALHEVAPGEKDSMVSLASAERHLCWAVWPFCGVSIALAGYPVMASPW